MLYAWMKFRHEASKRIVDIDEEVVTLLGMKALSTGEQVKELVELEKERGFLSSIVERVN